MPFFIVGGNRKNEDEPLKSLISYSRKLNLNPVVITDKIHLFKECENFENLKQFFENYKIKYFVFNDINKELKKINKLIKDNSSYLLAVNSIWIFKNSIINLFKNKIFNLHIGKLPNQKGAGGASWQFLSQDKSSAATIHEVTNKIDEGKVLIEKNFNIKNSLSLIEYYKNANIAEKKILKKFVNMISKKKKLRLKKVNKKNSVYMPRLDTKTHGFINWAWKGDDILNFIRAFDKPHIGASTFYKNKLVHLQNGKIINKKKIFHPFQSGIIIEVSNKCLNIAICNGILKIFKITNSRGKEISLEHIKLGERFHTPIKFLEDAKQKKSLHTGKGIKIKNG